MTEVLLSRERELLSALREALDTGKGIESARAALRDFYAKVFAE